MLMMLPRPAVDHRLAEHLARQQRAADEVQVEHVLPRRRPAACRSRCPGGSVASGRLPPAALTSTRDRAEPFGDGVARRRERVRVEGVGRLKHRPCRRRLRCACTRSPPRSALRPTMATWAPNGGQRLGHGAAQGARAADDGRDFAFETEEIGMHRVSVNVNVSRRPQRHRAANSPPPVEDTAKERRRRRAPSAHIRSTPY